ncbi:MAG TPA: tetratricopeptide repeat protein [Ktedonosporobacter sp.]|nr:tetratricopeptide repeat protein [Ktedonosporobacter sp.]
MEIIKLVWLDYLSIERDKYIWEHLYARSWDLIIGRIILLKAHYSDDYEDALDAFDDAIEYLQKAVDGHGYSERAMNDKAITLCRLEQYEQALATIDQALEQIKARDEFIRRDYITEIMKNRAAILILNGKYDEALESLQALLKQEPEDSLLQFNLAACLLRQEKYDEALVAYKQFKKLTQRRDINYDPGLEAAKLRQQPDWEEL